MTTSFRSHSRTRSVFVRMLAVLFVTMQTLLVPAAHAAVTGAGQGMIGTAEVLQQESRAENEARIHAALARDDASSTLERFGVAPEQVDERLDRLSDSELASLADQAEDLPAGEGALGVLVFILVLLIILDLLGVTNVFPAI
ncbi:PA2779 family protein [Isoalcanivorax pacificus]|nr:PA2779 family protein [Isoalcanivorax pacificus]